MIVICSHIPHAEMKAYRLHQGAAAKQKPAHFQPCATWKEFIGPCAPINPRLPLGETDAFHHYDGGSNLVEGQHHDS